jgi:hypothetical protein
MALAPFDIRHALSIAGTYDIPFGRGRRFGGNLNGFANALIGDWSTNGVLTWDTGQPLTINCTRSTGAGNGCFALYTGQDPYAGQSVAHWYNAAAFRDPPVVTQIGQTDMSPLGGSNTQVTGPPLHRLDFSVFKTFPIREQMRVEFRAECFNLTNTPIFNMPVNLNYLNTTNFAQITSTRDNPNDPRQIQLALKVYW